jgi:hypothetical protein
MNRNMKTDLPGNLRKRIGELLEECSIVQAEADPKAHIIKFESEVREEVLDYIDEMLELSSKHIGDKVRQQMATRIAQKAIRISALCAVFNKGGVDITIEREEWEWAKRFAQYEYEHITEALGGLQGEGGDKINAAVSSVYMKMKLIIDDDIKDKKCRLNKRYRQRKIIPLSVLKISLANNPWVKELNDKHGKYQSGLEKVLDIMRDNGAIKIHTTDPLGGKSPRLVEILEGMNDFIRPYTLSLSRSYHQS